MLDKLLLVCLFTLIIHATETLSYAVRLAGIRTGRLAVALSLTGIILLVSRTSNLIQAPMTGALVDAADPGHFAPVLRQFRMIIGSASWGTLIAIVLFPTIIRLSSRVIAHLELAGSVPLLLRRVSPGSIRRAVRHVRYPRMKALLQLRIVGVPKRLLVLNGLVTAIYTTGVLSSLYASLLLPDMKATALMSSGLINGVATIIMALLVDPQVGLLTDKALHGEETYETLNKMFALLMFSRFFGTLLAQLLFIPAAYWITWLIPWFA